MNRITTYLFLLLFNVFLNNLAFGNNNAKYTKCTIAIDQANCSSPINSEEIIKKEFGNTSFVLDLLNKKLIRIIGKEEKMFAISKFENNTITLSDVNDGYLLSGKYVATDNQIVLTLKEKEDECYSLIFTFNY